MKSSELKLCKKRKRTYFLKKVACRDLPSDLKPNKEVNLLKQGINKP